MPRLRATLVLLGFFAVGPPAGTAAAAACEDWLAVAVSVQGSVQARRLGDAQWHPARLSDTYCAGDALRVDARGRAAIRLRSGGVLRLDQHTTITFAGPRAPRTSWIELLVGAVHFISRVTRGLTIQTPFVNANVEGTEFWIEVTPGEATVTVLEGRIEASNALGAVVAAGGQAAVARAGQGPVVRPMVVTPADAVQWALYYPPTLDTRSDTFPDRPGETWPALVRRSIELGARGDLEGAFASLAGVPADVADPRFPTYRAGLLLAVGRADEAVLDIDRAQALDPRSGRAAALRTVIAVVRNEKAAALALGRRAVELDPASAAAHIALSYAEQANFDLEAARDAAREAVAREPENALARARLAELWLSSGDLGRALDAAREAARLDPTLARAQVVLGFAFLVEIRLDEARAAFERAIQLDQAEPLARLGLGLTRIRGGQLETGREDLEIAVSLDPATSLLRSYLGKAYYEEKRDAPARDQFALAEKLDARDPTPLLYEAIERQSVNRPVEALDALEQSIALNDNRAVYRSRLLLDEDLATRSASLARIYDDLGFRQLALSEGWRSLDADPANASAHRFLSDTYSVLPRHEVARVSELLQAQLLQPINLTPVEPQLGATKLFIVGGADPRDPGFNEFNSLFERNRVSLYASGLVGSNQTYGDALAFSGLWNRASFSVGQFHYQTDGFRANNDLTQDIYNVFVQASPTPDTSVLAEYRHTHLDQGDILRFDPSNFTPTLRQKEDTDSIRLGFRHVFTPGSTLIGTVAYETADSPTAIDPETRLHLKDHGYTAELQHLYRWDPLQVIAGASYFQGHRDVQLTLTGQQSTLENRTIRQTTLYLYSSINYPKPLVALIGASGDLFDGVVERNQFNPKLGLTWTPFRDTVFRAAAFRVLKRTLVASQTIEPTQVAGFNQFFDDPEGTDAWLYGIGFDQKVARRLFVGAEFYRRDLRVPFTDVSTGTEETRTIDWSEDIARGYLYWAPHPWIALSAEYYYERLQRDPAFVGPEEIVKARTHLIPLTVSLFHPSGLGARVTGTYVDQNGTFGDPAAGTVSGGEQFWLLNAALSYRLPRRWGIASIEVKNLLDHRFRFQETDPARPLLAPERLVLFKLTLGF